MAVLRAVLIALELQNLFIHDVYRALPMNVDFTIEQEKLMTNPYIVKSLGTQAALGFKSCYVRRDLTGVVPWIILNLRHISVLITFFFQYTNKGAKEAEVHEPGEYSGPWKKFSYFASFLWEATNMLLRGSSDGA